MLSTPRPEIEQDLSPGERLVWSGQPHRGIRFRGSDWIGIPFSVFWCGFAIFWEVMALTAIPKTLGPVAAFFPLFGVPFILIGLYLVFGRFIVDARVRARTYYGLTGERIIIIGGLFGRRTKSLNLWTLSDVSLSERQRYYHFRTLACDGAGFPVALVARRPPIRPARLRNDR